MWVNLDYPFKQGKSLSEVARGTMFQVLIFKTRIVSGYGELIADTITRCEMTKLSDLKVNLSLGVRPSRVLWDYVKKPFVNYSLSSALLNELTCDMPVIRCSYSVE